MTRSALPAPGDLLPYGHPALQVDQVLRHEPRRLVAAKTIDQPGRFPPSLMIESFLQAGGLLLVLGQPAEPAALLIFGSARNIRVTGTAHTGDLLVHTVELVDRFEDTAIFTGFSQVGDVTVLSVERAVTLLRPAGTVATRPDPPPTGPGGPDV